MALALPYDDDLALRLAAVALEHALAEETALVLTVAHYLGREVDAFSVAIAVLAVNAKGSEFDSPSVFTDLLVDPEVVERVAGSASEMSAAWC